MILTAILLIIGLVVVYSISPGLSASQNISQGYFVSKQLIDVGLGIVAFIVASFLPTGWWRAWAKPLAIIALIGAMIVMITPIDEVYQAHRWIKLGGFSFQIAELMKIALLVWVASFLEDNWRQRKLTDSNSTLKPLLLILLGVGIIVAYLQSDLGSAGVLVAMMGIMAYAVGIPLKKVGLIVGLIAVLVVVAVASSGYRRERLNTFLHPGTDCQGSSYQACQALISVGSGGVFGLGLGYSVQAYGYLPEASNDSIFAIIAEKFGFIGSLAVVTIYAVFIARLKHIIAHTTDQFNRLLVVGVLAWLSTQMIINIGAMIGLLPIKGITLPLISQGGTSIIFLTAALGVVFQISRYTSYRESEPVNSSETSKPQYSFDRRGIRRPHNPDLVARPRT
jgi:cell division protein FtsW